MIKKFFLLTLLIFFINSNSFSAGGSSDEGESLKAKGPSKYRISVKWIDKAKKFDKKGKTEKAQKFYKKAFDNLIKINAKEPGQADVLNYLGFTSRKLGDFENAETYYLLGLEIEPNHYGINEYLGELYVNTDRLDLAKERLKILKDCNCEEFEELKSAIEAGKSKY